MESLWQDLRFAWRMLVKRPVLTLVAVLTLALGIGATTAIFSVVNAVLLRPLPYDDPDRLVMIWGTNPKEQRDTAPASFDDFRDFQQARQHFQQIAAASPRWSFNMSGGSEPQQIFGMFASANLFSMLGVKAHLGRFFTEDEDKSGVAPVAVMGYSLWQQQFGGRQDLIGQAIRLGGNPVTIIGIAPADFQFLEPAEIWLPLAQNPIIGNGRAVRLFNVVGKLKDGASIDQAQTEMASIARQLERQFPNSNTGIGIRLVKMHEQITGKIQTLLWALLGAVVFVLLIACVNVTSLMLAQASVRQKEVAIRSALGASRWRLIRQLLIESVLLAIVGGAAGTLLAIWGIDFLLAMSPGNIPRQSNISVDGFVLAFALLISFLTGIVAGLAPAFQSSGSAVSESLKENARGASAGWRQQRLRAALVAGEMALALVLLTGAGLLIKSFIRLLDVNPGYATENMMIFNASLPQTKFAQPQQRIEFYRQIEERLKSLPDVASIGIATRLPLFSPANNNITTVVSVEGKPVPEGQRLETDFRRASNDYFRTMGIPLIKGRVFNDQDYSPNQPLTAVINEAMAARFWNGEDPIGKRFRAGPNSDQNPWITVVGVVGNVRHLALDIEPRPEMYRHHLTSPPFSPIFVVRTKSDPENSFATVRSLIKQVDAEIALSNLTTMAEQVSLSVATRRFAMTLFGIFAGIALLLAAVGLYAVMSYSVAQRTHEIGIRVAIGAQSNDVLHLIVRQGMQLVAIGVTVGLVAAMILTRLMQSLLFSVNATDPLTFTLVVVVLAVAAIVACYVPARRATKVDPMIALRYE